MKEILNHMKERKARDALFPVGILSTKRGQ